MAVFDLETQLVFYGAYHANKINVLIHIICVPLLLWSAQVLLASAPSPSFLPAYHLEINKYLSFDLNSSSTIMFFVYESYYFILEPTAALIYMPQFTLSLLTSTAFVQRSDHLTVALIMQAVAWIAQFIGHGVAEKRAPALLDNLVGAVVLAPFFVHLEILFSLGYRPKLHKHLENEIGKEITRVKKIEGDKRRAKAQ
ncbi:DUF962-domain-containing protein [Rhodocollybia butyracea]|uniref:DUF962-domain-containing protein n=1 Tax=Rhodocollybia butyracea TaxID=206335 RepID=A0A9P5Q1P6_9AGAR|nr:DUF962-domain-containing protein [Rhodocollybia butyracea]